MAADQHPPNMRRVAVLAASALMLVIIWYNRLFNNNPPPISSTTRTVSILSSHIDPPSYSSPSTQIDLSSALSPFISQPLHRLCTSLTTSNSTIPGLIFLCDENSGGPGNMRNYILTCIRYAIEAGATGLQIPRINTRSATNKADLFNGGLPKNLGYMFDEAHFRNAMHVACPHIQLFPTTNSDIDRNGNGNGKGKAEGDGGEYDLATIPGVSAKAAREGLPSPERMVRRITPKQHFGGSRAGCDERDPNRHTDLFGALFRAYLPAETSWHEPALVRLSWGVLWDWPVFRDGAELAASFGGLLRFREDVLELADSVVGAIRELSKKDGSDEGHVHGPRFLGIHLRTEEDALSEWPTYENQSEGYFRQAERQGFQGGVAYLASGSEAETQKFAEDARARLNLNVKSKFNLLRGPELENLKSLTWDQQALVDFVVLLESDYFVGVSPSSFSINVALKRHIQEDGLYTRPWKVGSGDQRSWLVGRYHSYWDDWLFMFDGMWP